MGNVAKLKEVSLVKKKTEEKREAKDSGKSRLEKAMKGIASKLKNKKSTNLYIDREVYEKAQHIFGQRKVGAVVEVLLREAVEEFEAQQARDEALKKGA